jgi:hypothetical protein
VVAISQGFRQFGRMAASSEQPLDAASIAVFAGEKQRRRPARPTRAAGGSKMLDPSRRIA